MGKDTWLKLHTSILTSRKFISLPHNDHRQAFFILLLLAKKGLESAPESYLLGHLNLSKRRWKMVKSDLIKCGLLDSRGTVNGFIESQLTPDAHRKREQRQRGDVTDKAPDMSQDIPQDSRKQKADSRKQNQSKTKSAPREFPDSTEGDGIQIQGLVHHFIELRQANDPGATIPGILMPWQAEMGRIRFTDKREYSQIREVLEYSQADEFWMGSILTPRDLRQKFQKLVLHMKRGGGKKTVTDKNKEFLETYLGDKGEVHEREA